MNPRSKLISNNANSVLVGVGRGRLGSFHLISDLLWGFIPCHLIKRTRTCIMLKFCILQTELEEAVIKQKEAKAAVDIQR